MVKVTRCMFTLSYCLHHVRIFCLSYSYTALIKNRYWIRKTSGSYLRRWIYTLLLSSCYYRKHLIKHSSKPWLFFLFSAAAAKFILQVVIETVSSLVNIFYLISLLQLLDAWSRLIRVQWCSNAYYTCMCLSYNLILLYCCGGVLAYIFQHFMWKTSHLKKGPFNTSEGFIKTGLFCCNYTACSYCSIKDSILA